MVCYDPVTLAAVVGAGAAVVGAGVGGYSAYESHKNAQATQDKQKEAMKNQFAQDQNSDEAARKALQASLTRGGSSSTTLTGSGGVATTSATTLTGS